MLWTRTAETVAERLVEHDHVDLAAGEVVDELLDTGSGEDDVESFVLAGGLDTQSNRLVVVDDCDSYGASARGCWSARLGKAACFGRGFWHDHPSFDGRVGALIPGRRSPNLTGLGGP
jgi:hypothetical protein